MFKPMLAVKLEGTPRFPVMASYKIDGVRALVRNNQLVSRKLKPIPNEFTYRMFSDLHLEGFDGELIVGNPWDRQLMSQTTSGVMSGRFKPDVRYLVFDLWNLKLPFLERLHELKRRVRWINHPRVEVVEHRMISTQPELDAYEQQALSLGYEGLIIRDPNGPYKEGRSTLREGWMLKVKRFVDAEARVIGVQELEHNHNAAEKDELGHTKRSTAKAGKTSSGMLGALVCVNAQGQEFNVGTGFDLALRLKLWREQATLVGKTITYRHFAATGAKEAPRFPVFVAFRHEDDQ